MMKLWHNRLNYSPPGLARVLPETSFQARREVECCLIDNNIQDPSSSVDQILVKDVDIVFYY